MAAAVLRSARGRCRSRAMAAGGLRPFAESSPGRATPGERSPTAAMEAPRQGGRGRAVAGPLVVAGSHAHAGSLPRAGRERARDDRGVTVAAAVWRCRARLVAPRTSARPVARYLP